MTGRNRTAGDWSIAAPLALGFALLVYLFFLVAFRGFVVDDTYITFRYADNLVRFGTPSFNPGDVPLVDGYTSYLWMLLAAAALEVGADPLVAARVVAILSGAGAILLLYRIGRRLLGHPRLALLAPLALAATPGFAEWSLSGMETSFFLFLLLLALHFRFREDEGGKAPVRSSAFFGLAALTRPEATAFFAIALAVRWLRAGRPGATLRRLAVSTMQGAAVFLLVYGPYFVWHLATYGDPWPNSYYAKRLPGAGGPYVIEVLRFLGPVFLFALAGLALALRRGIRTNEGRWFLLFAAMAAANVAALWNANPVMAWDGRLLLPLFPLVYLSAARSLRPLLERGPGARRAAASIAAALVLWTAHPWSVGRAVENARSSAEGLKRAHVALGRWMNENLPPETRIAVVDTGAIPYFSRLPALDIANVPLNDKRLIRGEDARAVIGDFHPDLFVLAGPEPWKPTFHPGRAAALADAEKAGFALVESIPVNEDYHLILYASPRLAAGVFAGRRVRGEGRPPARPSSSRE